MKSSRFSDAEIMAVLRHGEAGMAVPDLSVVRCFETFAAAAAANPDLRLVRLIAEAMAVREMVLAAPSLSLTQIAQREGRCRTKLGKLLRLSWLSPRLLEAILDGAAPARLKRQQLLDADLPLCWRAQDRLSEVFA